MTTMYKSFGFVVAASPDGSQSAVLAGNNSINNAVYGRRHIPCAGGDAGGRVPPGNEYGIEIQNDDFPRDCCARFWWRRRSP